MINEKIERDTLFFKLLGVGDTHISANKIKMLKALKIFKKFKSLLQYDIILLSYD